MKTFKDIRQLQESHYPTQGSSIEYPEYKEMDMENLVQDAIKDMPEDDGPHTSKIADPINFQTVADPTSVINQSSSKGNIDNPLSPASRMTGKPFKSFRKKRQTYGGEDFSGAVAGVAIGEEVEELSELSPMTKKIYLRKATASKQSHLQKAKEHENAADVFSFTSDATRFKRTAASERYKALKRQRGINRAKSSMKEEYIEEKGMKNPCWKGYKSYGTKMKNGREVPNCVPIKEGSARAAFTKRGAYAKNSDIHSKASADSEKSRGVETSPETDARKYSRTHTTPYNSSDPETKKMKALRNPKKQVAVPLQKHDDPNKSGSRITDILNHPFYKKKIQQ